MPYPLTAPAQAKINSVDNVSMVPFIEFTIDGRTHKYSTIEIFDAKEGLRLNASAYEFMNSTGQSGSLPINIVDETGEIFSLFKGKNIIKSSVSIYIVFTDLTWNDKVLVFSGKIETPFKWSENTRIITFNCLPHRLEGKITAPIVFGDMPGVQIIDPLHGLSATSPIYVRSAGKRKRNASNIVLGNDSFTTNIDIPDEYLNKPYYIKLGKILCNGSFIDKRTFHCNAINTTYEMPNVRNRDKDDLDYENRNAVYITGSGVDLAGKYIRFKIDTEYNIFRFAKTEFETTGGSSFGNLNASIITEPSDMPQVPENIKEDVFKQGSILVPKDSTYYNYVKTTERKDSYYYTCKCSAYSPKDGKIILDAGPVNMFGEPMLINQYDAQIIGVFGEYPLTIPGNMYNDYSEYWTTGDSAKIEFIGETFNHTISVLPSNSVTNIFNSDMEIQTPQEYDITLSPETSLKTYGIGNRWCSVSSTVGPNIVDIIQYIIENYTELTFNADASLHTIHSSFPVGFYYTDDVTVKSVLDDICVQACLKYTIYGNDFTLKDATTKNTVTSEISLTKSNLEIGSLRWNTSRSSDLFTTVIGKWSITNYPDHIEETVELENNIDKFDENIKIIDFNIYHAKGSVERAVTFYLDLYSNIWEYITFRCFLYCMNLYLYERVTVDTPIIGSNTGIIEEFDFTASTFSTKIKLNTLNSTTGGKGYLDGTWDGTYDLAQLDNEFLRLNMVENALPDKVDASTQFMPALVPGEGFQTFGKYMSQKTDIVMRVIAVYLECLVCRIVGENDNAKYAKAFGKNPMGANFMVAWSDNFFWLDKRAELAIDGIHVTSTYYNKYNQALIDDNGKRYFITPTLVTYDGIISAPDYDGALKNGSEISVKFSQSGFLTDFRDHTSPSKPVLLNFKMTGVERSWAIRKGDIFNNKGNEV